MILRWSTAAAIMLGAAVVGLAVWVMGLNGLANRAESICLSDLDNRLGDGGYEISRTLWWPSFECRLRGNSVDPIDVHHPLEAVATFGWIVVVPVLYAIATLAFTLRWTHETQRRQDM